jgi:ABC-type molybdate transport system substrate-binding protein
MAIGDAVGTFLGNAVGNYQPSSGVEVQLSALVKNGDADAIFMYDGINVQTLLLAAVQTGEAHGDANSTRQNMFNMAIMMTNSMYIRKTGTTDRMYLGGVQTNA